MIKLASSLLAASAASLALVVGARSEPVAASPIVGTFGGGAVFYGVDGYMRQMQYARLTVTTATAKTNTTVQWNWNIVPLTDAPVCTHHLALTRGLRKNVELAFRVSSVTGSCIPNPRTYRISWLDRKRAVIELTYADGQTASGLLRRR